MEGLPWLLRGCKGRLHIQKDSEACEALCPTLAPQKKKSKWDQMQIRINFSTQYTIDIRNQDRKQVCQVRACVCVCTHTRNATQDLLQRAAVSAEFPKESAV